MEQKIPYRLWLRKMKRSFYKMAQCVVDFDDLPDLTNTHDLYAMGMTPEAAAQACYEDQISDDPLFAAAMSC